MWNNLQWRLYFFMNDWYCMCDFEHECPFWKKTRQVNILCKIPSDSNTGNITRYWEFSNPVLGHAIQTLPGMHEKTWFYIFTSVSRRLRALPPLEIHIEIDVLSYCHERPSDLTMVCKVLDFPFEWGIYLDMYNRWKFLFDQQMLLKSWYFLKNNLSRKFVYGHDRGHRSKHVLASRP